MSPELLAQLHQGFLAQGGQPIPQKSVPKKKNFWLDQISTAGGILGGIGGSFITPLAGTAVGAGAGSALGEAIENKLTGDSLGKNVIKEGALGAVFGAGPIKLAKAGLGMVAKTAGKEVAEQSVRTASQRGVQKVLGEAWGIKTGAKVGSEALNPQEARSLQQFLLKEVKPPKAATADMVAERLVNFRSTAGKSIDDIVSRSDRVLNPAELTKLNESVIKKFSSLAGVDPQNPIALRLTQQVGEKKTLSELIQFRRSLDDAINFARNEASPDPVTERSARTMRSEIDKLTSKAIPGLKTVNGQYAQASKALDYVLPAAKNPKGLNILGNRFGGATVQKASSAVGQAKNSLDNSMGRIPAPVGISARLGALGAVQGGMNQQTPPASLEDALMQSQSLPANTTSRNSTMNPSTIQPNILDEQYSNNGELSSMSGEDSSPFAPQNLETAITAILSGGGTLKDVSEFVSVAKAVNDLRTPKETKSKALTGESRNRALKAKSGLVSLDALEETLGNDPGAFQRQSLPNPLGITARLTGTTDVRAATDNLVDVIARLRSGAAITDSEAKRFSRLLPQPGDSSQSAHRKLANLRMELENYLDPTEEPETLEDALLQYQ